MPVRVTLFCGVHPAYRRSRDILQRGESGCVQDGDKPTVGFHLFGRKQLSMSAPKQIRKSLQESFIVNGLATEDFF